MADIISILYVEDDEILSSITIDNLQREGFKVFHAADGIQAIELFKNELIDLCIVDVMLPKLDGFTLVQRIRDENNMIPVLFLTAKNMKDDKLHGLRLGADDYITKPFSIEELVLKIRIFIRRSGKIASLANRIEYVMGSYRFVPSELIIMVGNHSFDVTLREAQLLEYFCQHRNQIIKREDILRHLWGQDDYFMGRSMDVFISRLRKILKSDPSIAIDNVHGVGFRFRCS